MKWLQMMQKEIRTEWVGDLIRKITLVAMLGATSAVQAQTVFTPSEKAGALVQYELLVERDVNSLLKWADTRGYGEITRNDTLGVLLESVVEYPVDFYRLEYMTPDGETMVKASGLVMVPKAKRDAWPLVGYQHGTIMPANRLSCPSNYSNHKRGSSRRSSLEVNLVGAMMASHGYVVAMPDYLGYGASEDLPIRYTYTPSLAAASRDMLRATREFCQLEHIGLSEELFLAGWSEGAGATMALHRLLQNAHAEEFTVTAQSSLSGFYHYSRMIPTFAKNPNKVFFAPLYMWSAWVLNQQDEDLQLPADSLFQHHYRRMPEGLTSLWTFGFRKKTSESLLHPALRQRFLEGQAPEWADAVKINNHYDWRPAAPVFLHHGKRDPILPYFHSNDAFVAMAMRGAPVKLYTYPKDNHWTMVDSYLVQTLVDFDALLGKSVQVPVSSP